MTAIDAVFVNTKRIASRKAYQIILEVPEEVQDEVHRILGWPKSDGSVWVGVARLHAGGSISPEIMESTAPNTSDLPQFCKREL